MQQNKIGEKLIQRVTFYFEWRNLRLSFLGSFHLVLPYCYVVHFRLTNVLTTHALWVNTTGLICTVTSQPKSKRPKLVLISQTKLSLLIVQKSGKRLVMW